MKTTKTSFLFLFITFLVFVIASQNLYAQTLSDSLIYYKDLALNPKQPKDLFSAFEFFNTRHNKAIDNKNYTTAAYLMYYISSIDYKKGAYEESEKSAVKGLEYIAKMPSNPKALSLKKSYYNLLGLIYIEKFDKNKSLELYRKTLEVSETVEDSIRIYNNLSLVFKNHNEYSNARDQLLKAYALLPKTKDTLLKASIYDNLGYNDSKIDNANGLDLMLKALEIRTTKQDKIKTYSSYRHLAKYYSKVNDTIKALDYAAKNYRLAKELNSPSFRLEALSLLVDLKQQEFTNEFKTLSDSLSKAEKKEFSKYMLLKYDYSEFERKALESELMHQRQQSRTIIVAIVAIGITIISVLGFLITRAKHKRDKLKQLFETESRISKQVHDEVANNIFQVMTKFESKTYEQHTLADELHELYHKARDISNQYSLIDPKISFEENLESLFESYISNESNIVIKGLKTVKWKLFSDIKKNTIYKVLQELLINMKKHSQATLVLIVFENKEHQLKINYTDNGVGAKLIKHTGLQNTENRIHAISGTIIFDTEPDKGFKAKIVI